MTTKTYTINGTLDHIDFPFDTIGAVTTIGAVVTVFYKGRIITDAGEQSQESIIAWPSPPLTAIWEAAQYDCLMAGIFWTDEGTEIMFDLMRVLTNMIRGAGADD